MVAPRDTEPGTAEPCAGLSESHTVPQRRNYRRLRRQLDTSLLRDEPLSPDAIRNMQSAVSTHPPGPTPRSKGLSELPAPTLPSRTSESTLLQGACG